MSDRLSFDVVERFIADKHPDPDPQRQTSAAIYKKIIAAKWAAIVLDVTENRVNVWRATGLDYYTADAIATRLGEHPSRLWDDWWQREPEPVTVTAGDVMRQLRANAYSEAVRLREAHTAANQAVVA